MYEQERRFLLIATQVFLLLMTAFSHAHAQTVSCTSAIDFDYMPAWGQSVIGIDTAGARANCQYFYWNRAQRMTWLRNNADSTYEHDTFFYNYDGRAYGTAPTGAWTSNMPYPYVDTQAFDSSNEKAVTIGTANAQALRAGIVYYYTTQMVPGVGTSSWYKVSAQRGRRVPSSCYSTYCSFGCDTQVNNLKILPFGAGNAPECREWVYKWGDNIITNYFCP